MSKKQMEALIIKDDYNMVTTQIEKMTKFQKKCCGNLWKKCLKAGYYNSFRALIDEHIYNTGFFNIFTDNGRQVSWMIENVISEVDEPEKLKRLLISIKVLINYIYTNTSRYFSNDSIFDYVDQDSYIKYSLISKNSDNENDSNSKFLFAFGIHDDNLPLAVGLKLQHALYEKYVYHLSYAELRISERDIENKDKEVVMDLVNQYLKAFKDNEEGCRDFLFQCRSIEILHITSVKDLHHLRDRLYSVIHPSYSNQKNKSPKLVMDIRL